MTELSCHNKIAFWRWHERKEGVYFWDDLDHLMDMAEGRDSELSIRFAWKTRLNMFLML